MQKSLEIELKLIDLLNSKVIAVQSGPNIISGWVVSLVKDVRGNNFYN